MAEKRQTAGPIEGEALSPGVVTGCLVLFVAGARPIRSVSTVAPDREVKQFHARIAFLLDRLGRDVRQLRREGLTAEAQIMETHLFLLRDRIFQQKVESFVRRNRIAAEVAVEEVLGEMIERLERSGNLLLAERSADVRDIIRRLREQLDEEESALFATLRQMRSPVLAVPELLPSLVLEARRSGLGGFVVERGTSLSHAGIMIEVPSAVWDFEQLVEGVDFASVGTNDLLQYFFAADRSNANARQSYQPLHPAALRMLGNLVQAAERAGKPLSLCGEIASDLYFLPLLVGLGFRDLSADVRAVAGIRRRLAELDVENCRRLAQRSLKARTGAEVREVLHSFYPAGLAAPPEARGEYVDPICGMVVDPEETPFVVARTEGDTYFCSHRCRDEYLSRGNMSVRGVL